MTGREGLRRVLASVGEGRADPRWLAAADLVTRERAAVERFLDTGGHAYGFSTELGHLDRRLVEVSQATLLSAHLIGPQSTLSPPLGRLVTACKLEQVHLGGSGVSPETYRRILRAMTSSEPLTGSWLSSYGSGDVVPGAWWARQFSAGLRRGDVIALINGTFVSTALTVATAARLIPQLARLVGVLAASGRARPVRRDAEGISEYLELCALVNGTDAMAARDQGQLPVSLRDVGPHLAQALLAIGALGDALERRLASPSANPLFEVGPDDLDVVSQSSFLDPHLTGVLLQVRLCLTNLLGLAQRAIQHRCESLEEIDPGPAHVQPPKVANAIIQRALSQAGWPGSLHGDDSRGVEDVRDLSLLATVSLEPVILGLSDVLDLAAPLVGVDDAVVLQARRHIDRAFLDLDHSDSWSLQALGLLATVPPPTR